ncbi:hypothetical protein FDB54_06720 [Clostridium botulinum]|nr:hypothetical protein [Clostridium botulinum]
MINENLKNKMVKYEELKNKITTKYKESIQNIDKIMKVIENNQCVNDRDSFETIVFKKYLELESVKKVADYINELGYRIKTHSYIGERKYTSNDISAIIASDVKVETKLKDTVKDLFSQHSIAMYRRYC